MKSWLLLLPKVTIIYLISLIDNNHALKEELEMMKEELLF